MYDSPCNASSVVGIDIIIVDAAAATGIPGERAMRLLYNCGFVSNYD